MNVLSCVNKTKSVVTNIGADVPRNPDGSIGGAEDDELHKKVHPGLVDVVGIAGLAASVATMALTVGHLVDAASYSTIFLAPYAAYQKHELKKLGGMRGQQNLLREHVNTLQEENNKMAASIDTLETQVNLLEGVEHELDSFAKNAQTSVDRLTRIVEETDKIHAKITKNLERQVLSDLISIVVQADNNRDFTLNDRELNMLIMRLKGHSGVKFDGTNFRKFVPTTPVTLEQIMKVVRNLMDESVPQKDNVFTFEPEEMLKQKK